MRPTPLYRAYVAATRGLLPLAARIEARKLARAGVASERTGEKRGYATQARPEGRLIWFHAASVGESLSVLSLITELGRMLPLAQFLITSGTPTSADLVARRMPPRSRHQFAPLDAPGPVDRFLDHWRPDAAVFVESELWPQMLWRGHEAGVPLALVNARLSEASLAGWRKRPDTAAMLLSVFRGILTQTPELAEALVELGANPARVGPSVNLKSLSAPLPVDAIAVAEMRSALAGRKIWVAASTHAGEEPLVLEAHAQLVREFPDLCLILAPRHPARSAEVAALIADRGWPVARRSAGEAPGDGSVYLADTMGELGNWYAMTPFVFLGGSLRPIGGHNPFEVAQAGAAVLTGPHVTNFTDSFAALAKAGGAVTVDDAEGLADAAHTWLAHPDTCAAAQTGAGAFAKRQTGQLRDVAHQLVDILRLPSSKAETEADLG